MTLGDLSSGRRCSPGPDRLRVLRGHPEHRSGPGRSDGERSGGTRPGTGPTADSSPVTSPLPDAPYGTVEPNPPGSAVPPSVPGRHGGPPSGDGARQARMVTEDRGQLPIPYAVLAVVLSLSGLAMVDRTWGLLAVLAGALAFWRGRRS